MHETRLLCLAVSRREGGNCIAGIDIDSKKWIRPINSRTRAAFADADLVVRDPVSGELRFMAPLDLIAMNLESYAGTNSQPENWIVAPASRENPYAVLRRCEFPKTTRFLRAHSDRSDRLLHGPGDSVQESEFATEMLSHSLSLVAPREVAWRVSPNLKYSSRFQVRAYFRFGNFDYNLVVTDPVWEAKCCRLGLGMHTHAEVAGMQGGAVFLSISLAAVAFHGLHYKLVAGVMHLPG
jgi:hypothetical protein